MKTISKQQITEFDTKGVVFLDNYFSKAWIEKLKIGIGKNILNPGKEKRVWSKESEGQYTFYDSDNWRKIPEYREFVEKSSMKNVAAKLLNTQKVNFFFDAIFVRSAGVKFSTPWHQDEPYWSVEGYNTVSIWMPLVDVRKESALAFVPGSHRWGKKFRQQDFGELNPENEEKVNNVTFDSEWEVIPDIDNERDKYKVISWNMKAGDCVAFNARIIHGGGGNLLPNKDLKVFNTQWLGDDIRVCFKESGMDPDHSKKMREAGMKSGDKLSNELYPAFHTYSM
jgi:ectoine hydroxylase-related dioxygenase (phytanoyl-CoA dioxygenase family)|tara:strand:- start:1389 stop:2234 length:846 start_codon:yes stop_codon:yes gene_type:complete